MRTIHERGNAMHPWLNDLDGDGRAWRCVEGTIKALNRKLTRAAREMMNFRIKAARAEFRRIDAEGKVTVLKKRLGRLRRRVEQQSRDDHGDGLIGLAAFESSE